MLQCCRIIRQGLLCLAVAVPLSVAVSAPVAKPLAAARPRRRPQPPKIIGLSARLRGSLRRWSNRLNCCETPVDAFVLTALEHKQLTFAPPADRAVLLRRLTFDLTGLPPTPRRSPPSWPTARPTPTSGLVERFLASPRYGERWGKYWLDAAGYADSNGYFDADTDRPLAYRYRDYVIRSLERRQAVRPVRPRATRRRRAVGLPPGRAEATPEIVDLLVATHFLRNAPGRHRRERRQPRRGARRPLRRARRHDRRSSARRSSG